MSDIAARALAKSTEDKLSKAVLGGLDYRKTGDNELTVTKDGTVICTLVLPKGEAGNGVSKIEELYAKTTSKTDIPPDSAFSAYDVGKHTWTTGSCIWTATRVTYTNGTVAVVGKSCDSSWEAVNEVQVGGRNLIQIQNMEQGSCAFNIDKPYTPNTSNSRVRIKLFDAEPNAYYTMTSPPGYYMTIHCYDSNKIALCDIPWRTGTFTFKSHQKTNYLGVVLRKSDSSAFSVSDAANIKYKLEKGNKATDYTPAFEDVQNQIDTSKKLLDDIVSDSKLAPNEKQVVKREWINIKTEYEKYELQCKNYSVSYTAYKNAYDALNDYFNTINSGIIFNMNATTDISREEFNSKFATYYSCKVDMINALEYAKARKQTDNILAQREIYSTSEQVVGTWIDGKPLYQKTVDFGSLPNATNKEIEHNIANVKQIWIDLGASFIISSDTQTLPLSLPMENTSTQVSSFVSTTTIGMWTGADRTNCTAIITVKYTKTTD